MTKMHPDEVDIDLPIVRNLIETQFPQWSDLPLTKVESAGTDNAMYRLGNDRVVRLPRIQRTTEQVRKEQKWLPKLAPHLPLNIPVPLGLGKPSDDYPFVWSIYKWLNGKNATLDQLANPVESAKKLAQFLLALQSIDTTNAPIHGEHNFGRGVPLALRDKATRDCIAQCEGMIDTDATRSAWEKALSAPVWDKPPIWIHGDIQAGNLLAQNGDITAVIDWGALAVGDPAVDLLVAWTLFPTSARQAFREALQVDDAMWQRGRGWAVSFGAIALPYYVNTNPVLANIARTAINAVLDDEIS